jgi:hypothetical protein
VTGLGIFATHLWPKGQWMFVIFYNQSVAAVVAWVRMQGFNDFGTPHEVIHLKVWNDVEPAQWLGKG